MNKNELAKKLKKHLPSYSEERREEIAEQVLKRVEDGLGPFDIDQDRGIVVHLWSVVGYFEA